jgi:hypothetical protein
MSVSLIVLEPKEIQVPPLLIPIASQDTYTRVWLRGAAAIGAFWLPMFETGVDVSGEDFPEVQAELALLKNWVATASIHPNESSKIQKRIDQFVDGLVKLRSETAGKVVVFIG